VPSSPSAASRCSVECCDLGDRAVERLLVGLRGFVEPLTLRTYCSAASWISSDVTAGSKLWSCRMLRHMTASLDLPRARPSLRG
jgi:hypothetical protein